MIALTFLHRPPAVQGVPSRKFWLSDEQVLGGRDGDEHVKVHVRSSQEYVSLPPSRLPINIWHWRSLLVHCPLAQARPFPHDSPSGLFLSGGQLGDLPVHFSSGSQGPVLALQTLSLDLYWQFSQHSSFESSQTALALNLHVRASQQGLPLHEASPPQSQSSPSSTIPFPHWLPVMVTTPRLFTRQSDRTLFRPMPEQMLPTVQGENCVIPRPEVGFMMNLPFALQEPLEKGQH